MSVRCERRATAHYFMDINQLCLPGLLETLILYVSSVAWRSVVDAVCDHMRVCTCARKQRVH